MTLRVLTLHFGGAPYLAISRRINERYCRRHGLEFIVADRCERGKLDAVWSKVTRAREALAGCDTLLYLDADAVFVDHDAPIDALTSLLPPGRSMLIGEDFQANVANTGAWLVRNTPTGHQLLGAWDDAPNADPTLCTRWPLDEAGFNERVLPAYRAHIELKPRRELNLIDGPFIRHFCMQTISAKTDALAAIAKRMGL